MRLRTEEDFLNALQFAEREGDAADIERSVADLALYYTTTGKFLAAAPFWRRGAELLAQSTAPDARELGTYLQNMAELCLVPAGLLAEAHEALLRSREIYLIYFQPEELCVRDVDALLVRLEREFADG